MCVCCHSSVRSLLLSCLAEGSAHSGTLPTVISNGRQEPSGAGALLSSSCQTDGVPRPLLAPWGFRGVQARHMLFPLICSNPQDFLSVCHYETCTQAGCSAPGVQKHRGFGIVVTRISALWELWQGSSGETLPWPDARCTSEKHLIGPALTPNLTQPFLALGKPGHAAERGGASCTLCSPSLCAGTSTHMVVACAGSRSQSKTTFC